MDVEFYGAAAEDEIGVFCSWVESCCVFLRWCWWCLCGICTSTFSTIGDGHFFESGGDGKGGF